MQSPTSEIRLVDNMDPTTQARSIATPVGESPCGLPLLPTAMFTDFNQVPIPTGYTTRSGSP
jgi:hypothetical protein